METAMTASHPRPGNNADVLPSPPSSPFPYAELPIIATDDLGMIADDEAPSEKESIEGAAAARKRTRKSAATRRKITYVSRHFVAESPKDSRGPPLPSPPKRNGREKKSKATTKSNRSRPDQKDPQHDVADDLTPTPATPPVTPARGRPRIYYGLNIDDLSSDSSFTDVPDDIGPDPFLTGAPTSPARLEDSPSYESPIPGTVQAIKIKTGTDKARCPTKSPYFPHPHKHRPTFLSTLPFPPLSHDTFGLMQERLAHDPFRLLIATIFLNKTPGERAMPIFYQLMSRYPTPSDLAGAEVRDITSIIYGLGFQNQRAKKCVAMAKAWLDSPPQRGKRYRKLNYPRKGDGKDIRENQVLDDDEHDGRVAWEISHLPGLGPYSHDSWRIFCRDQLRGVRPRNGNINGVAKLDADEDEGREAALKEWDGGDEAFPPHTSTLNGTEDDWTRLIPIEDDRDAAQPAPFEPEWKRVVPADKELRAYLTWKWIKEGWVWNKETGERRKAPEELMTQARGGGIVVEEKDSDHLVVKGVDGYDLSHLQEQHKVERTAGDFLPDGLGTSG